MRYGELLSAISLAMLLAGCGGVTGVESRGGSDVIEIRGQYTTVSHSMQVLERQLNAEADKRCPNGWTKVSDKANPFTMAGGRIWEIRCNKANVATNAGPGGAVTAPPPAQSQAPRAPAGNAGVAAGPTTTTVATTPAGTSADVVRVLTSAVLRAAPYLTEGAAQAIVNQELSDLMGAKVRLVGPEGQSIPIAPPGR